MADYFSNTPANRLTNLLNKTERDSISDNHDEDFIKNSNNNLEELKREYTAIILVKPWLNFK